MKTSIASIGKKIEQKAYVIMLQCSYGNCQTTFHPSCARSAGFHMTGGGKLPHKAYCEKHSLEQKAKVLFVVSFAILLMAYLHHKLAYLLIFVRLCLQAESQKHGVEELKSLKHYRVGVLSKGKMILPLRVKRIPSYIKIIFNSWNFAKLPPGWTWEVTPSVWADSQEGEIKGKLN